MVGQKPSPAAEGSAAPQPVPLPQGLRQLGAFAQATDSGWQTLVATVDDVLASPAPIALPVGSRCILKRRECWSIGLAERLLRDVRPLSVLQHPNVVQYFGVLLASDGKDVLLVCEFCSRGSLLDLIYHQRKLSGIDHSGDNGGAKSQGKESLFSPELVLEVLVQISSGLKYLHDDLSLAHGNLTSANTVLDGYGTVKITDVGLEDALDSPDYDPAGIARDTDVRRGARGGRGYWAPERSLANVANGGYFPSGPSATADCWSMGCVATELVSGTFVHERLQDHEADCLAQAHALLESTIARVVKISSCGQCGGTGMETCAGCRSAWLTSALLTRDPMRRPSAARACNLLESAWVQTPESTKVGTMVVPPLSIPPPWHRRPADGSAHTPRAVAARRNGLSEAELARPDGSSILAAVREAIDGADWRVFKDGHFVPSGSQWHHDKIITAITCENRAPTPHPRGGSSEAAAAVGDGAQAHGDRPNEVAEPPRRGPLSERQRAREERKGARRGLADLYRDAKAGKQHATTSLDPDPRPGPSERSAESAGDRKGEQREKGGGGGAGIHVPLSSLKEKEGKAALSHEVVRGSGRGGPRGLGVGVLEDIDTMLRNQTGAKKEPEGRASKVGAEGEGVEVSESRDLWDDWLRSLGVTAASMSVGAVTEMEEDTPSIRAAGAGDDAQEGWAGDEEDCGFEDGEMGPQEVTAADRQVPMTPAHLRAIASDLALRGDSAAESSSVGEHESGGVEGQKGPEGARDAADVDMREKGGKEARSEERVRAETGDVEEGREGAEEREGTWGRQKRLQLADHMVSVTNVAGNRVHVIGAAPNEEQDAREGEDEAEAASRVHRAGVSPGLASPRHPQPTPADDDPSSGGEGSEMVGGGILAVGTGGAAVAVRAELVASRAATARGGKGEAYTVFVLRCQGGGVVWEVSRRYSEFAELHLKLLSLLPAAKGGASRARSALASRMPSKVLFGANSPDVVAHRQAMLAGYVAVVQRVLQQHSDASQRQASDTWVAHACEAWVAFCAVPSTSFAAAALSRAGHSNILGAAGSPPSDRRASALRGVLRHSPASAERKAAKRVEVEEGRRQVVWGSDGILQLGNGETFIAGTPQREPGPRSYKNGAPKLVDPSGPFRVGWWEEEEFVEGCDKTAIVEPGNRAVEKAGGASAASGLTEPTDPAVQGSSALRETAVGRDRAGKVPDPESNGGEIRHPVLGNVAYRTGEPSAARQPPLAGATNLANVDGHTAKEGARSIGRGEGESPLPAKAAELWWQEDGSPRSARRQLRAPLLISGGVEGGAVEGEEKQIQVLEARQQRMQRGVQQEPYFSSPDLDPLQLVRASDKTAAGVARARAGARGGVQAPEERRNTSSDLLNDLDHIARGRDPDSKRQIEPKFPKWPLSLEPPAVQAAGDSGGAAVEKSNGHTASHTPTFGSGLFAGAGGAAVDKPDGHAVSRAPAFGSGLFAGSCAAGVADATHGNAGNFLICWGEDIKGQRLRESESSVCARGRACA